IGAGPAPSGGAAHEVRACPGISVTSSLSAAGRGDGVVPLPVELGRPPPDPRELRPPDPYALGVGPLVQLRLHPHAGPRPLPPASVAAPRGGRPLHFTPMRLTAPCSPRFPLLVPGG